MDQLSITDLHHLVFIIPGFLVVWVFRYFTKSKKKGDFELLGLSFVWGLLLLVIIEFLTMLINGSDRGQKIINDMFKNPYVASIVLLFFAAFIGWGGSCIRKIWPTKGRKIN